MSAIDENETLEACIARVQEEEGVDEAAARQICEDLRGEGAEEASIVNESVETEMVVPMNASAGTSTEEDSSVDAEINTLVVKQAQRQPGESMADCVARIMEEEDVDEETARETCGQAAGEEASVKQAQRQPGETMGECIERVMEEEDVDRATARETCRQFGNDEE